MTGSDGQQAREAERAARLRRMGCTCGGSLLCSCGCPVHPCDVHGDDDD